MTHFSCRNAVARLVPAIVAAATLTGCVTAAPMTLVSAVDLVLSDQDAEQTVSTGPISVDELLAKARESANADAEAVSPTATVERGVSGMDGPAFIALGEFLSALGPVSDRTVLITRSEGKPEAPFADAQFAIQVGRLIEGAGHAVRIAVSPVQTSGSLFLAIASEESA